MRKRFILYVCVFLLFQDACRQKEGSRKDVEVGDKKKGIVRHIERKGLYSREYNNAADLMAENKVAEAIMIYRELLEKDTLKDVAYAGLGACYNVKKEYRVAISYYEFSLKIDSNNITSLIGIGSAYSSLHSWDTSISYYNKVKRIDSLLPETYWGLAVVYDQSGEKDMAKENAQIFIQLAPDSKYRDLMEQIIARSN